MTVKKTGAVAAMLANCEESALRASIESINAVW